MGEGIAVAFPGRGWLLIDSCRTKGGRARESVPLEQVWVRWRGGPDDDVRALIFTHPHEDHAEGFPELVEVCDPQWIGVTGTRPPTRTLLSEYQRLRSEIGAGKLPTDRRIIAQQVESALQAIATWHGEHPHNLVPLFDGATLPIRPRGVTVRAPDSDLVEAFFGRSDLDKALRVAANELSAVLEICFGRTRVVLASDLPTTRNGADVATGWNLVMGRHPDLGHQAGLKIPHHGSHEAMHPGLMSDGGASRRAWWVTPKNASGLPRCEGPEGLCELLSKECSILLTSMPASRRVQAARSGLGRIAIADLAPAVTLQRARRSFLEGAEDIRPGTAVGPLDAIWATAFDNRATVRGIWRGAAAVEVVAR